jgi:hypothetical protein
MANLGETFWDNRPPQNFDEESDPMQSGVNSDFAAGVNQVMNQIQRPVDQQEATTEEPTVAYDLDVVETQTVSKAILRLEQGRLYQMLIEHNFFDGVQALDEAVQAVQEELKSFIIERLEILLGIRDDVQKEQSVQVELPFNDMEIMALKQLAFKITGGASAKVEPLKTMATTIKPLKQNKRVDTKPLPTMGTGVKPKPSKPLARKAEPKEVRQPIQENRQENRKP